MSMLDRFDAYTVSARLLPFLAVVSPALLLLAAWLPATKAELPSLATMLLPFAATGLVAHFSRDEGRRKQSRLFRRWGGTPTSVLLRHRSRHLNPQTRARYHARLAQHLGRALPSAAQERRDPIAADEVYASCADFLREKTRDKDKFPLVHAANREYGFRRNLWGMKPAGITLGLICLAAAIAPAFSDSIPLPSEPIRILVAAAAQAVLLVFWTLRVTPEWVKHTGFAYAERLLATCESL